MPKNRRWLPGLALAGLVVLIGWLWPEGPAALAPRSGTIQPDERVIFFNTMAARSASGERWSVPLHAWIFEPEKDGFVRSRFIEALRSTLGLSEAETRSAVFRSRVRTFLADNERGKRLVLALDARHLYELPRTPPDGHSFKVFDVPHDAAATRARGGWLELRALTRRSDERLFVQRVRLLEPEGLTIISDIDDTVKISHVTDKRQLLHKTFFEPFEAVPGMADAYRRWHAQRGAHVHFVSSSPWQLYEALSYFLREAGFPEATYSLKRMRLKDSSVLDLFADPLATKVNTIEGVIRRFPRRRYVLVGDSGERDPEVYAAVFEKHAEKIEHVFIRNVTGQDRSDARYAALFARTDPRRWTVFTDAADLRLPGE